MNQARDLLGEKSFRDLVARKGITSSNSIRRIEEIEVVDLLETICNLGDSILVLVQEGRIPEPIAESWLLDLANWYADPLANVRDILKIQRKLREYSQ